MMTFGELLLKNEDAIAGRWLDDVLATYSDNASVTFKQQKDPFANPVGNSLRLGTRGIVETLLREVDSEKIHGHLCEMVKIRAVQQFSPSEAVGFVFRLKEAVRAGLGKAAAEPRFSADLTKLDGQIDQIALAAFDIFTQCREQVSELRLNEVKRRVSWVVDKLNGRRPDPKNSAG